MDLYSLVKILDLGGMELRANLAVLFRLHEELYFDSNQRISLYKDITKCNIRFTNEAYKQTKVCVPC